VQAALLGFTGVIVTSAPSELGARPEHTMVDGVIELSETMHGRVAHRYLEVKKLRGTRYHRGQHTFEITADGLRVHPRIESLLQFPSKIDHAIGGRLDSGIPRFDEMIGGGIPTGSTTMLLGPSGAGKTVFGLQFLSRSRAKEPGLLFGFYETPARLADKARSIGVDLDRLLEKQHVEILWQPPIERMLDDLGGSLLDAVRRRNVKRLFIDGLGGFIAAAMYPERVLGFFTALANELRVRGVTTLYTVEARNLLARDVEMPISGVSAIVENLVMFRFVELDARLYRMLSIVKVRDSDYDPSFRQFAISERGMDLASTFESAESILSGHARPLAAMPEKLARRRR
jgi:circadian clock protein KaiC